MKYCFIAKTPNGCFAGMYLTSHLTRLLKEQVIKDNYVITEAVGTYDQVRENGTAHWILVRDFLNSTNKNRRHSQTKIENPDLFYAQILDLKGRVTKDDIKTRYRELANQYHPDKVAHLGPKLRQLAEEEMQKINDAFSYFRKKYNIQ